MRPASLRVLLRRYLPYRASGLHSARSPLRKMLLQHASPGPAAVDVRKENHVTGVHLARSPLSRSMIGNVMKRPTKSGPSYFDAVYAALSTSLKKISSIIMRRATTVRPVNEMSTWKRRNRSVKSVLAGAAASVRTSAPTGASDVITSHSTSRRIVRLWKNGARAMLSFLCFNAR